MGLSQTLLDREVEAVLDDMEAVFLYGAVGTDGTAFSTSQTALGTEVFRKAISDIDRSTPGRIIATTQLNTTEANSNALQEQGVFNQSSGGSMWIRNTFTTINKTSDINVFFDNRVDVTITQGSS